MENAKPHTHLTAAARRIAAVLAVGLLAGPAGAQGVEVGRAATDTARLTAPDTAPRACWARYSEHGGKARDGVIEEVAFRVPCPDQVTPDFIASLQRALKVRDIYDGPVTGRANAALRAAVRAYQRANGFDSPILTLHTAQQLGLAPHNIARR